MKSSNTVVTVIVVAAVLLAAYAVGLLIHQARQGDSQPQAAAEANEALVREGTAKLSHGPEAGRAKDTPQERAKLKDQRAQALENMDSATDEQKQQFRQQVRERFADRRGTKGTGTLSTQRPAAVRDPNTSTKSNSERTGAEPNGAGQG